MTADASLPPADDGDPVIRVQVGSPTDLKVVCDACWSRRGGGGAPPSDCPECGGRGMVQRPTPPPTDEELASMEAWADPNVDRGDHRLSRCPWCPHNTPHLTALRLIADLRASRAEVERLRASYDSLLTAATLQPGPEDACEGPCCR